MKKIQISRFINTELRSDSDSEPDSEVESKSDAEFMAKLKSDSDSEFWTSHLTANNWTY